MACDDRANIVFPKGFYMPRILCVQVRHFSIWRQLAPPPRAPSGPSAGPGVLETIFSGPELPEKAFSGPELPEQIFSGTLTLFASG